MASGFSYDWNWAEQAESEEEQLLALSQLFEQEPELEILFAILQAPWERRPDFLAPHHALAPAIFELAPAGCGPLACALLNPHSGSSWASWLVESLTESQRAEMALRALEQLGRGWGPLCCVPEQALSLALQWAWQDDRASGFFSDALVALFQPFDDRPPWLEDVPRAPACALLLRFGARASHRCNEGRSALSGINALLSEAALGMANPTRIEDLLRCAALLLDAGASPSSVREEPPIARIVPNAELRDLLCAREEDAFLRQAIEPAQAPPASSAPQAHKRL